MPIFAAESPGNPLSPQKALATFQLDPGLKIECIASEPTVVSPVAMDWDESGRMYVVEDRGYPLGPAPGEKPQGQIILLESTHHDGHYDKRTVFADGLTFPNGVLCWRGGIFVTCAPYLYYFKDTDGDGVADLKQIIFQGFGDQSTTQQRVSHPLLNIDGWIYLTSGFTSANLTLPLHPNRPPVVCDLTDFRFQPGTGEIEAAAGIAQFGQTFDNFGRKFICSNRNHNQIVMIQLQYANRNPDLTLNRLVEDTPDHGAAARVFPLSANITTVPAEAGHFTSACGILYYRGSALPADYRDNSFTCEPAGNLIHRDLIRPTNSTFVASRASVNREFLASTDNWFRPVNLACGPDGALYVCDMYRGAIEHPNFLTNEKRAATDFNAGKDKGRIYRITGKDFTNFSQADLSHASTVDLCELLNHPNAWQRTTAQRLLLERNDVASFSPLASLCKNAPDPETRVLALRILDNLDNLRDAQIEFALADKNPGVRENALQLAEPRLKNSPRLSAAILVLANDPDPRVRFQCALTLGELDNSRALTALAQIAARDSTDHWTRAAILSSVRNHAADLLEILLNTQPLSTPGASALITELTRMSAMHLTPAALTSLLEQLLAPDTQADALWQKPALAAFAQGLATRPSPHIETLDLLTNHSPITTLTRDRFNFLTNASAPSSN
ncbi:MAG TPA: PVC-type heme-binding CxxCH protein [Verrucomicrobiae bacterium]|nr:PVC-type heme-binding CxxCH protein [Verrucomicrobiae bacterium]